MSVYACRYVGVRVWVGLLGSWVGLGGEAGGGGVYGSPRPAGPADAAHLLMMHACACCSPVLLPRCCRAALPYPALLQHAISAEALDILSGATDAKGRQLQVGGQAGHGGTAGSTRAAAMDKQGEREGGLCGCAMGWAQAWRLPAGCQWRATDPATVCRLLPACRR